MNNIEIKKLLTNINYTDHNDTSRIKYIVIHYVGALGGAKANCEYYASRYVGASAHYYVGFDGEIWQSVEDADIAWSVGASSYVHKDARNSNTLNIEMCVRKRSTGTMSATDKDWYFEDATVKSTIALTQYLMKKYNIPVTNVIRHYDVTGKICPNPFVYNNGNFTWDDFKRAIESNEEIPVKPSVDTYYRVRKTWEDAKSQLGAYTSLDNAKKNCPFGYSVFDPNGKSVFANTQKPDGTQPSDFAGKTEEQKATMILELAKKDYEKTGVLASVTAAQMILESGYVTTDLAVNACNCFGMKCTLSNNTWANSTWDGESKYTKYSREEYTPGVIEMVKADFRKYPKIEDSLADHSAYLLGAKRGDALRYAGLKEAKNYEEAITIIKNGGYATDSKYIEKICGIIKRFGLNKYDRKVSASETAPTTTSNKVQKDLLAKLAQYQKHLKGDIASGKIWKYYNSGCTTTFKAAIKAGKYKCNCALLVRWALRELGLLNSDNFWGEKGGYIVWRGTSKAQIEKNFKIIKINNMTVDTLLATNYLYPGDILTYTDMQHTNVYAGNGKWYDGGHAYAIGAGDGAKFKSWYGSTKHGRQRVAYIIRSKGATKILESSPTSPVEKPQEILMFRVGTAWTDGKCVNQYGAYSVLDNAKKSANSAMSANKTTYHVFDNNGKIVYTAKYTPEETYVVQAGAFSVKANADALVVKLNKAGFSAIVAKVGEAYVVRCGTFTVKANAERLVAQLKAKGFNAIIK